jgi:molybdate transport system substrate-binding protein
MKFPPRQDAIAVAEYETPRRKPGLAVVADPPELIARRAVQATFFGFFVDMFEVAVLAPALVYFIPGGLSGAAQRGTRFTFGVAIFALAILPTSAIAAEIKALVTIGVQSAIEELAPQFEKVTGHKISATFGLSTALSRRIQDDETADLFIGTREEVNGLMRDGKIASGSDVTLASSGIGIAVRKGTQRPDISTPEALKRTLLASRAIGYGNPTAGGAAAVHFAKVLERLAIVEEMKAKTKFPPAGGFVGKLLVSGEVDLAVQQIPQLIFVSGAEVVGPLPGDLQVTTVFAAAVPSNANQSDAARALITFLRSREAAAVLKATGYDPG